MKPRISPKNSEAKFRGYSTAQDIIWLFQKSFFPLTGMDQAGSKKETPAQVFSCEFFVRFLRTSILQNICERLLMNIETTTHYLLHCSSYVNEIMTLLDKIRFLYFKAIVNLFTYGKKRILIQSRYKSRLFGLYIFFAFFSGSKFLRNLRRQFGVRKFFYTQLFFGICSLFSFCA